jgi:translation initiation factor IF-3
VGLSHSSLACGVLLQKLPLHQKRSERPTEGAEITTEPRINDRIRTPQIRLINYTGEQVGVVDIEAALAMADEIGLDLVEIAPEANPPVCKIMDFGKFK